MVKIRKGKSELLVSDASFRDTFQSLGYQIVGEEKAEKKPSPTQKKEEPKIEKVQIKEDEDVVSSDKLKAGLSEEVKEDFGFTKNLRTKGK